MFDSHLLRRISEPLILQGEEERVDLEAGRDLETVREPASSSVDFPRLVDDVHVSRDVAEEELV